MRAWQVHHVLGPRSRLIQRSSGQPRGEDRHPEIRVNPTDAHTLPTPNPPQKKRRKGGSTKREKEPLVRSCSLCRREGACRRSEDGGDLDLQPPQCSRRSRTAAANWRIFAPTENHAKVPRARLAPPVSSHSFNIPIHRYINDSSMPRIRHAPGFPYTTDRNIARSPIVAGVDPLRVGRSTETAAIVRHL